MGFLTRFLTSVLALTGLAGAASLKQITNFTNPAGLGFYIYVPDNVGSNPSIIVAIHYCTGTAQAYYQNTKYAQMASQYNYIVIYPQSPYSGTCFDVSSNATLTHNGGGDSNSIANMVQYTIDNYGANANNVYVTGSSSGAMMTNVMVATYPELFQAGSVYNGVPAGCFYTGTVDGWNTQCAEGKVDHTAAQWAQIAHQCYPGYSGTYPRMLIYHGTADTTLSWPNYAETIKQWSGVFGYSGNVQQQTDNFPSSPYTEYVYGPRLVGIVGTGIGHTVPVHETTDLQFFGFIPASWVPTSSGSGGGGSGTTTSPPATSTTSSSGGGGGGGGGTGSCSSLYGQCGGQGWTGPTCCSSGTCKFSNDWYSQCL